METLQETLQQLICIVNSLSIFAHYPDHGSSGIWLIQGIQVLTQSGNDALIPGLSEYRCITGVNWTCFTPFPPTSFHWEPCTEFVFCISTQQAAFSFNYRWYSQAFFLSPKLSTEISQGLCSLIHQQDHPDVEFKIKLPPFQFTNGNIWSNSSNHESDQILQPCWSLQPGNWHYRTGNYTPLKVSL